MTIPLNRPGFRWLRYVVADPVQFAVEAFPVALLPMVVVTALAWALDWWETDVVVGIVLVAFFGVVASVVRAVLLRRREAERAAEQRRVQAAERRAYFLRCDARALQIAEMKATIESCYAPTAEFPVIEVEAPRWSAVYRTVGGGLAEEETTGGLAVLDQEFKLEFNEDFLRGYAAGALDRETRFED